MAIPPFRCGCGQAFGGGDTPSSAASDHQIPYSKWGVGSSGDSVVLCQHGRSIAQFWICVQDEDCTALNDLDPIPLAHVHEISDVERGQIADASVRIIQH